MRSSPSPPDKETSALARLEAENEELRVRLLEAEETLLAIRTGAVDAMVVEESAGHRIYTLEGAERPYRLFVEEMHQGAATLFIDGTIAWCNRQLADLLKTEPEKLIGATLQTFVSPNSLAVYQNLLWQGQTRSGQGEAQLLGADGGLVPAYLTFNALPKDCGGVIGVLITDLTTQRHHEELTAAHASLRESEERLRESERHLREMIDALPVAIYTTDAMGRLTHFNPAAVEFSGRVPELGNDRWCVSFKLFHADGTPMRHDECPMAIALTEGRVIRGSEAIAERPDGSRVWFTPYPTPLRDSSGRIVGGINLLLDITERRHAEEAGARLAAIVHSSDDAIISKTLDGIVTSWNASAERLLGYTAQEMIGQSILRIIPPDLQEEEARILGRLRREENIDHFETVRLTKAGRRLDVSLSISPVRGATGRTIGASKIMRDISERKRAEEALQAAQAQLQEHAHELETRVAARTADLRATNEQLEAFVHSVAHDLRSPLRSMAGFSQLLLEQHAEHMNETGKKFLRRIQVSSEFMDKLLLDLLSYGRTARAAIDLGSVEVQKAWDDAVFQAGDQVAQTNARLEVIGPLPAVRAHEATLCQCLANLLTNALKFVAPGVQPHIRFYAEELPASSAADPSERRVRLWLQDNGIGIAPELQDRAFQIFERLHGTRFPGTGVGLSIVRKGVERMGGKVGLQSEPGQGSRFWIELFSAR